jgi:deazaflavin-dependent oxidoreductase (nitroreductase family)
VALRLTSVRRRSGLPRTTPLIYATNDDAYVVIASDRGGDEPPDWCQNVTARNDVTVLVGTEKFKAGARHATETERPTS